MKGDWRCETKIENETPEGHNQIVADQGTPSDSRQAHSQGKGNRMTYSLLANPLPTKPHWLRASTKGGPVGVDRTNNAVLGFVVAQQGPFLEPDPRGEFDEKSLRQIVVLMKKNANGTKSRLGHPTLSDDGISKFMGRALNPRMDSVVVDGVELLAVRADLYLAESAFEANPNGNLGEYVLQRAEEDPNSFASSLVLQIEEEWRLDNHKQRRKYEDGPNMGKDMPPLWRPLSIHATDLVDSGAAVTSFLSADILAGLPDAIVRQGCELLDAQFSGLPRNVVEARLGAFVQRYLNHRYGEPEAEQTTPEQPAEDTGADERALLDLVE
jgi:hypothetical protein